jgi:hypothetical protein
LSHNVYANYSAFTKSILLHHPSSPPNESRASRPSSLNETTVPAPIRSHPRTLTRSPTFSTGAGVMFPLFGGNMNGCSLRLVDLAISDFVIFVLDDY